MKRFLTSLFSNGAKPRTIHPPLTERNKAFLRVEALEDRQMLSTAAFLGTDISTQGNWIGKYGIQGYEVFSQNDQQILQKDPSYAKVSLDNANPNLWAGTTSDVRALQKPGGSDRISYCWFNSSSFTINVNLNDGQAHNLALYVLDWDGNGSRSEQLNVVDAGTGTTLDSRTVSSFSGGDYLAWTITGNVQIKVTYLAGSNAVASGLFFDAASQATTAMPAAPTGVQWTPTSGNDGTLSWSAVAGADGYHVQYSQDNSQWVSLKDSTGANLSMAANQTSLSITNGAGYYFRVSAFNAAGETFSSSILAQSNNGNPATAPTAPTQLTWTGTSGNDGTLSWSNVAGASGYDVYYYDSSSQSWVFLCRTGANQTSVSITNGYGYYFSVGAFNDAGETFSDAFRAV